MSRLGTCSCTLSILLLLLAAPAAAERPQSAARIPVVDGEAGPCSAEFTVTTSSGKPVYGARIRVHVEYGFLDLNKLDLQVVTNSDGKARFEGLPDDTPLFFRAAKGRLEGVASYNPENKCHAEHAIFLLKRKAVAGAADASSHRHVIAAVDKKGPARAGPGLDGT